MWADGLIAEVSVGEGDLRLQKVTGVRARGKKAVTQRQTRTDGIGDEADHQVGLGIDDGDPAEAGPLLWSGRAR